MITREEFNASLDSGFFDDAIEYVDKLEKHIKSLEAQLSNTEQLKCETRSNFLELVAKERTRQIVEKGYSAEHDDEHTDGSIANAGACYGSNQENLWKDDYTNLYNGTPGLDLLWPWEPEFFKKNDHDRKHQLIIGAAFYMAEYDRIVRSEQKDTQ